MFGISSLVFCGVHLIKMVSTVLVGSIFFIPFDLEYNNIL